MRLTLIVSAVVVAVPLALAGCGGSAPSSSATNSSGTLASSASPAYALATGVFAPLPSGLSQHTRETSDCNLDSVDGKPAGSASLQRAGSATFSGWAADSVTGVVPAKLQLVLTGVQDFSVTANTGAARPDVVKAQHAPAFAMSGYAVKADLSAVPAGDYGVTLLYTVAGQTVQCATKVKLSVQ